jgi:hypothetical protein
VADYKLDRFLFGEISVTKFLLRVAVAFLTFIIGVFSASLWLPRHHQPAETIQSVSTRAVDQPKSTVPGAWQRIDVDDRLSFYLPADMTETEVIGDCAGPCKGFRNKRLWVNYGYSETDSCDPSPTLKGSPSFQSSQVEIGRRKAQLSFWQSEKIPTWRFMTVCFRDIGDGKTGLSFGAFAKDPQSLEVAKKVFDSIEFQ